MRLLPVGPDHGGGSTAQEKPGSQRQGHRRSDDQHLPLRNLPAHSRGRAQGGATRCRRRQSQNQSASVRETIMTKIIKDNATNLSRRQFIVSTAVAGSGLALGFNMPFAAAAAKKA